MERIEQFEYERRLKESADKNTSALKVTSSLLNSNLSEKSKQQLAAQLSQLILFKNTLARLTLVSYAELVSGMLLASAIEFFDAVVQACENIMTLETQLA